MIRRSTRETVEIEFRKVEYFINTKMATRYKKEGRKFDWSIPQIDSCEVYELFVNGDARVQGRIAVKHIYNEKYTYLELIEAAPQNVGYNGEYEEVGAHLFAIACELSFRADNEGYVQFEPKTRLIKHFQEKIGAKIISHTSMYFDTKAAQVLVDRYLEGR